MRQLSGIWAIGIATVKGGLRDKLLLGLLLMGILLLLSSAVFSSFSMRQNVEVGINYCLSVVQILATLIILFLGLSLISKEIETRSGYLINSQPLSRGTYILGKFFGLLGLSFIIVLFLGACGAMGILLVKFFNPGGASISWTNVLVVLTGIFLMCAVLSSTVLLFTSFATSALLPFLLTIAILAIGFGIQPVKNYIESGVSGQHFSPLLKATIQGAYYLFPNLNVFDFKLYAIYNLPIPLSEVVYALAYGSCYAAVLLVFACYFFSRRDLV